jgi:hypothetical protein
MNIFRLTVKKQELRCTFQNVRKHKPERTQYLAAGKKIARENAHSPSKYVREVSHGSFMNRYYDITIPSAGNLGEHVLPRRYLPRVLHTISDKNEF